jgi:glycosyltransferase involved in cell wall biosynthesis
MNPGPSRTTDELTRSPPKTKVVTLINFFQGIGGAERLAVEIALRLDRERFSPMVWTTRPSSGPLLERLRTSDVPVYSLGRTKAWQLWEWMPFLRFLQTERVDVVHAHGFGSNLWATVWGRVARVPVVIAHEHTWSFEGEPLRKFLDRNLIAAHADVLLAVSHEDRRRMREIEGIPDERTRYVANGLPPLPAPSGADLRTELGIASDAPVIGGVGVLRKQKGLDLLLQAVPRLVREFPDLRVLLAGGGPPAHRTALEAQAEALGVRDAVLFLGLRTDVADVLATLDVAVSSSRFEGTPLAIMEYMAAGKPIVATRVGGVPDLIEEGKSGVLVPPGDPSALADGIARVLRDPEYARNLAATARARQQRRFDIDVMVTQLEDLYESLVRTKREMRPTR